MDHRELADLMASRVNQLPAGVAGDDVLRAFAFHRNIVPVTHAVAYYAMCNGYETEVVATIWGITVRTPLSEARIILRLVASMTRDLGMLFLYVSDRDLLVHYAPAMKALAALINR